MTNFERDLCVMVEQGYKLGTMKFPLKGIAQIKVDTISLPTKTENWIKNNGIETLGELIDKLPDMTITRGVGTTTIKKTKNAILNFAYDNMSETNRKVFWKAVLV